MVALYWFFIFWDSLILWKLKCILTKISMKVVVNENRMVRAKSVCELENYAMY